MKYFRSVSAGFIYGICFFPWIYLYFTLSCLCCLNIFMGLLEDLVSWLFFFKWSKTNRNHFKQIGFVFHLLVFIIFCFVYLLLTIQVIWIWVVFQLGGWLVFNMCNTPRIDMMALFFPSFSSGYQGSFSLDSVMIELRKGDGWLML